ncbi:hypothetical protein EEX84_08910 [Planococcus salinus]|uniref:Uncharacterized protein n=1 Tax=Planococcus salinus TaxID=1848460 RepID=A0A3M8P7D9_9BACL|nr:hypothetical protein EEX84_08910 [Planococcus salinus]
MKQNNSEQFRSPPDCAFSAKQTNAVSGKLKGFRTRRLGSVSIANEYHEYETETKLEHPIKNLNGSADSCIRSYPLFLTR